MINAVRDIVGDKESDSDKVRLKVKTTFLEVLEVVLGAVVGNSRVNHLYGKG